MILFLHSVIFRHDVIWSYLIFVSFFILVLQFVNHIFSILCSPFFFLHLFIHIESTLLSILLIYFSSSSILLHFQVEFLLGVSFLYFPFFCFFSLTCLIYCIAQLTYLAILFYICNLHYIKLLFLKSSLLSFAFWAGIKNNLMISESSLILIRVWSDLL